MYGSLTSSVLILVNELISDVQRLSGQSLLGLTVAFTSYSCGVRSVWSMLRLRENCSAESDGLIPNLRALDMHGISAMFRAATVHAAAVYEGLKVRKVEHLMVTRVNLRITLQMKSLSCLSVHIS